MIYMHRLAPSALWALHIVVPDSLLTVTISEALQPRLDSTPVIATYGHIILTTSSPSCAVKSLLRIGGREHLRPELSKNLGVLLE